MKKLVALLVLMPSLAMAQPSQEKAAIPLSAAEREAVTAGLRACITVGSDPINCAQVVIFLVGKLKEAAPIPSVEQK